MADIREEQPDSLPRFLELVEDIQNNSEESMWYRGCGKSSYELIPSLYRHKYAKKKNYAAELEQKLMTRFKQRSLPYLSKPFTDDWNTLFFMQHYEVPTRLLDWTENPLIGLYFALMSAPYKKYLRGDLKFSEDATVWILDPVKWNRHALSHQSYDGGVLSPGDEALIGYKPNSTYSGMNKFPVALYGEYNSPRIVAQQGVFIIFGQKINPMEKICVEENFPDNSLIRIKISVSIINAMRKSLLRQGITESVVFPDLDGLAKEIKRYFGF